MTTETAPKAPEMTLKDGVVLSYQELGLWSGDIAKDLPPAGQINIRWHGAPIPRELWDQLISFFKHANATWKSEAQARLFYNVERQEWKAVVAPQRVGTGMYSGELKGYYLDAEKQALRDKVFAEVADCLPCGTAHSHCDCSAFQSGTDHRDELGQPGIHITFGRVAGDKIHVHGRVSFRKLIYPVTWSDWFPDWPEELDPKRDEFEYVLSEGFKPDFPKEWLDCCFEYSPPPARVYSPPVGKSYWDNAQKCWVEDTPAAGSAYGFGRRNLEDDEWVDLWEEANAEKGTAQKYYEEALQSTSSQAFAQLVRRHMAPLPLDTEIDGAYRDLLEAYEALLDAYENAKDLGLERADIMAILNEYEYGVDRTPLLAAQADSPQQGWSEFD